MMLEQGSASIFQRTALSLLLVLMTAMAITMVVISYLICFQYQSFLPIFDVWIHVDFLTRASEGNASLKDFIEAHNATHNIFLPKLAYFLDSYFLKGSGMIISAFAFLFLILNPAIISLLILSEKSIHRTQKIFLCLIAWIFMASPVLAENAKNPANLQWVILSFLITLTGFFLALHQRTSQKSYLVCAFLAAATSGLTSASALFLMTPLILMLLNKHYPDLKKHLFYMMGVGFCSVAAYEVIRLNYFPHWIPPILLAPLSTVSLSPEEIQQAVQEINTQSLSLHYAYIENIIAVIINFISPLISETKSPFEVFLLLLIGLNFFYVLKRDSSPRENGLNDLLWFLIICPLFISLCLGVYRGYSYGVFNFRFINICAPIMMSICLLSILKTHTQKMHYFFFSIVLLNIAFFYYISIREPGKYIHTKNHLNRTSIAYSLDIQNWSSVEEAPGMGAGFFNIDFVNQEKIKLKNHGYGIYSSKAYKMVGRNIAEYRIDQKDQSCTHHIASIHALSSQPAYGIDGSTQNSQRVAITNVFITDDAGTVIGYGRESTPYRELHKNIFLAKDWVGLTNITFGNKSRQIFIVAYNDNMMCAPYALTLPP